MTHNLESNDLCDLIHKINLKFQLAEKLNDDGNLDEANELYLFCFNMNKTLFSYKDKNIIYCLSALGSVNMKIGNYNLALEYYTLLIDNSLDVIHNKYFKSEIYYNLSEIYLKMNNFDLSLSFLFKSKDMFDIYDLYLLKIYFKIACIQENIGDSIEAINMYLLIINAFESTEEYKIYH